MVKNVAGTKVSGFKYRKYFLLTLGFSFGTVFATMSTATFKSAFFRDFFYSRLIHFLLEKTLRRFRDRPLATLKAALLPPTE